MLEQKLLEYERDFFRLEFCRSRKRLEERISLDFVEFGKSGCVYGREETIVALLELKQPRPIEIERFALAELGPDAVLARYRTIDRRDGTAALRASIWRREGEDWRLLFHQGTPEGKIENMGLNEKIYVKK